MYQQAFAEFSPTAPNADAKAMIEVLQEKYNAYEALLEEVLEKNKTSQEESLNLLNSEDLTAASEAFLEQANTILEVANWIMLDDQESASNKL